MTMVVTWVAGQVPAGRGGEFEAAYAELVATEGLPPGAVESFLLRGESGEHRIATLWDSRESLDAMRASTETPGAIRVFRAVGVKPELTVYQVANSVSRD